MPELPVQVDMAEPGTPNGRSQRVVGDEGGSVACLPVFRPHLPATGQLFSQCTPGLLH